MTSSTFNNNNNHRVVTNRTIITPLPNDVLCGHDKKYLQHQGNELYKRQIIEYSVTYSSCGKDRLKKMKITKTVVDNMKLWYNSRFLKQTHLGEWEELTSKQARDRVSHAIRFYVKSTMNQSNGTNNNFMLDDDNIDEEYYDGSTSSDSSSDPKQTNVRSASDSYILPSNIRSIEETNTKNTRAQSDGNIFLGNERMMYSTTPRDTSMSILPTIPSTIDDNDDNNNTIELEGEEENEEDSLFRRQQENLRRLMYSYEDRDNRMPL